MSQRTDGEKDHRYSARPLVSEGLMKLSIVGYLIVAMTATSPLLAVSADNTAPASTTKSHKAVTPLKMSCQEFVELDEVSQPQVVYWSEGFTKKGKPSNATIDMDTTNQLLPVLVEDCTKEPKSSFWSKVKMEFKKVF